MNSRQRRKRKRQIEITRGLIKFGVVHVDCWCGGLRTKDDPSEDDGKKYCGCAAGEAAFLAACRARRALKTGGLEE